MLDDANVIARRDTQHALEVAANQWQQVLYDAPLYHGVHDGRTLRRVVMAGMGGSALAALMVKNWLETELTLPVEIVRTYTLPRYVDAETLVLCSSYSGNTEETVSCVNDAIDRGAQVAIIASGGKLRQIADVHDIAFVELPSGLQPRMAVLYGLRSILKLLAHFNVADLRYHDTVATYSEWIKQESSQWISTVSVDQNHAKQLALLAVGKTPVFHAGHIMYPIAYKWKISWNETSKNVAFCTELPEFNHNEFIGWTSHPIEKPFATFDIISSFEHPQIHKRFQLSDKLLSGRRPKAHVINLQGDSIIAQMLWGCILADFASIYTAILNGVDPTPVSLIEKLKTQL